MQMRDANAPMKTVIRGWRIARMAAIRKVLSPTSLTRIMEIDWVNASNELDMVDDAYEMKEYREKKGRGGK